MKPLHVSDVIELSTDSTEGQFNKAVKLVISHCAANLKGYEVAVKQLIEKENNTWVDIAGTTVNLLSLTGRTLNIQLFFFPKHLSGPES